MKLPERKLRARMKLSRRWLGFRAQGERDDLAARRSWSRRVPARADERVDLERLEGAPAVARDRCSFVGPTCFQGLSFRRAGGPFPVQQSALGATSGGGS